MANPTVVAVIDSRPAQAGAAAFNAALATMRAGVASTGRALSGVTGAVTSFKGALATLAVAQIAKEFLAAGDSLQMLKARLELFAPAGISAAGLLDGITEAAGRARAPVGELAKMYERNAQAATAAGLSASENLRVTETLSKMMAISGATGESAAKAMQQLSQSLNSGTFRGEEFNSVAEQAPEILREMQRQTGKTAGELRKLAGEGKIAADTVFSAMLNAGAEVDAKFSKLPVTLDSAWTRLKDTFSQASGAAVEATGANRAWAEVLDQVREALGGPAAQSAHRMFAEVLKSIADGAKSAGLAIGEARAAVTGWAQAIAETGAFKRFADILATVRDGISGVWSAVKGGAASAGEWFASGGVGKDFVDMKAKADAYTETLKAVEAWQTKTIVGESVKSAATGGPKRAVKFGAGEDDPKETAKRIERAKQLLEQTRLQNTLIEAQSRGDTVVIQAVQAQLEVRQRVTTEMQKAAPTIAKQIEAEIFLQHELERQAEIYARNRDLAGEMASTLTDGLMNAAKQGDGLTKSLRGVVANLVEVIAKAAILGPLQKGLTNSISGGLGGFDLGGMVSSLFTGGGGLMFANGGVTPGPVSFNAGGMRGTAGEAGPEAILPLRRGPGGALGVVSAGGSGGGVQNNYFTVTGDATDSTLAKMREMAESVFARNAPAVVRQSVSEVRRTHRDDRSYLRR